MIRLFMYLILIGNIAYTSTVYADSTASLANLSLATMIENLSQQYGNIMRLVTAVGYVFGLFFIFKSLLLLRKFGEARTMMSHEHTLKGPIIYFTIGTMLLYLPSSIEVGVGTLWGTTTPFAYVPDSQDPWSQLMNSCFLILQIIGTIAFIRGLMLLTHLGAQHGQQGTFGKAMAHIIGGVLCINMYQFVQAVINTLAYGS